MKTKLHIIETTYLENPYEIRTLNGDHYFSTPLDHNQYISANEYLDMCNALPFAVGEVLIITRKYVCK